jgi:cephalosporin hydroxylase
MSPDEEFSREVLENIERLRNASELRKLSLAWLREIAPYRYPYNFTWLGRPIIQLPQDVMAIQELVWTIKPDLIIETGIAHGGSLIMSASMLTLLDVCEFGEARAAPHPGKPRRVIGIDIDIRAHNRAALDAHPLRQRLELVEGSSVDPDIVERIRRSARSHHRVLVCLDSNHTHEHVLKELEAYAPLVSKGSYCVVLDTAIEDMPEEMFGNRPWGKGNSPKTAVTEYLRRLDSEGRKAADGGALKLEIDKALESKLLITVAPDGYLKRTG